MSGQDMRKLMESLNENYSVNGDFEYEKLPNGDLKFTVLTDEGREELKSMDEKGEKWAMTELLEITGWEPNGELYELQPEDLGALTSAPIISDNLVPIKDDNIWWYPNYAVRSWVQEMLETGETIFTKAKEE